MNFFLSINEIVTPSNYQALPATAQKSSSSYDSSNLALTDVKTNTSHESGDIALSKKSTSEYESLTALQPSRYEDFSGAHYVDASVFQ